MRAYKDMQVNLVLRAEPSGGGLRVTVGGTELVYGQTFLEFDKGSKTLLAQVWRGPLQYEYPAPRLRFGMPFECDNIAHVNFKLEIPGSQGGISFLRPCPGVVWSGTILRDMAFEVTGGRGQPQARPTQNPFASWYLQRAPVNATGAIPGSLYRCGEST